MRIRYNVRPSRFVEPVRQAINANGGHIPGGRLIQITLDEPGYRGQVLVAIEEGNPGDFEAAWEGRDQSRFPARIRAAATALRDGRCFGDFMITYQPGLLSIARRPDR